MIIAVALTLAQTHASLSAPIAAVLDSAGFAYAHGEKRNEDVSIFFVNSAKESLHLGWMPLPSSKTPEDILEFWRRTSATWVDPVLEMPSRLPISGIVLDGTAGSSDKFISFATQPAAGRVYLEGKITQVNGRHIFAGVAESATKMLEGLVRWIIATESGAKFTPGNITADGDTYQAFKDAAGKWHIDAKAWAERHGWTYNENFTEGRIQFTTPRGNFLLPLGSEKVKLGETWHTLPLLVSARDRRILLSPEARQLASQ